MSMHFAPQWVKPIKPTGSSTTPGADASSQSHPVIKSATTPTTANIPFPALSTSSNPSPASVNASTPNPPNPALSYSRAIHTPLSPNFPPDGSYFPETNGADGRDAKPHPFRYSREQILALWDEDKVKETPFELVDMLENGGVLVSKTPNKPIGLRDLTEVEKKILATSVHPPMPTRRVINHTSTASASESAPNGTPNSRRPAVVTRDPAQPNGRGFSGFGRGEGGALGGGSGKPGVIGGGVIGPGDVKVPGVLGGGFGGVKRLGRPRVEPGEPVPGERPRSATGPWRNSRTTSGTFEGVLGFAAPQTAVPHQTSNNEAEESLGESLPNTAPAVSAWRDKQPEKQEAKKEPDPVNYGNGGGPGWGTGQRKWRLAAGLNGNEEEKVPNGEYTASTKATPSATPLPERDATVNAPAPQTETADDTVLSSQPGAQAKAEREDLGAVEWYYRDPNGQEQGPFTGTQMHDWYSHSYFTDDLPLRRSFQSTFHTLAELKASTGNAVQPFLSPERPRNLPPNLPIPFAALQNTPTHFVAPSPLVDHFQNLGLHNAHTPDLRSNPPIQHYQTPHGDAPYSPTVYAPQQYAPQFPAPGPGYAPSPQQAWGANPSQPDLAARLNVPFGSVGIASPNVVPIHPQQNYSTQLPRTTNNDFFSPSIGAGAIPASPWGVPPPQQAQYGPISNAPQPPQNAWQQPPPPATSDAQYQVEVSADEPSYFPAVDDIVQAMDQEAEQNHPEISSSQPEEEQEEEVVEKQTASPPSEPAVATPVQAAASPVQPASSPAKVATAPAQSVWAKPAPSAAPARGSATTATSVNNQSSTTASMSVSAKLPPAPASLPQKPTPARKISISTQPTIPTPEKPASAAPKPAPWAVAKEDKEVKASSNGPSLREIQEAEAKVAEARKQALAEARAVAVPSPALSSSEDIPQSLSWGLPSQGSKISVSTPSAAASPSTPVWGGGSGESALAPKKTLKQIQEEEEKRKAKVAAAAASLVRSAPAVGTPAAASKRGYADLAATSSPSSAPGWTTVGSTAKASPGASAPAAPAVRSIASAKPAVSTPSKPSTPVPAAIAKPKSNGADDPTTPSVEFIRWTKQALTGLTVPLDEFIQMLLTFPIDPPAANRADTLEIISDSVYANSSTLDGRRFAQEFYTRRKADVAANKAGAGKPVAKISSLADVLKTQPKVVNNDLGFKVVKAKGKKK